MAWLHDKFEKGTKKTIKKSLGWLPVAVMKVFTPGGRAELHITEKFNRQALNLLYHHISGSMIKGSSLSIANYKILRELIPQAAIPVVNVILSEASGGLTQRQARARGMSNIGKDYSRVADRLQDMKNKEEEVDMLIRKMLAEAPADELMDEITQDIKQFYKPLETKAAQSALAFLKKERDIRVEDIAKQAGQDINEGIDVLEFERYLSRLTGTLESMELTDEDQQIHKVLRSVLHTLPSCGNIDDSELESDEEPCIELLGNVKAEKVAKQYAQYIIDTSNRHKLKLWHSMRNMKYTRPNRCPEVIAKYPNVGKLIEEFVKAGGYGACPWRRTHMLCVGAEKDGTVMKTRKVTTETIKDFLGTKGIHVSKTTVHYLCAQHQFERYASHRAYGIANVAFRRPYRGFALKYSPDYRWSIAHYKMKDLAESRNKRTRKLGRDDATNFKCDSLEGHSFNKIPHIRGNLPTKGHTDFKDGDAPTEIGLTGYFYYPGPDTELVCVYVVKPKALYSKNATQHFDDYMMILNDIPDVANLYDVIRNEDSHEIMCHRRDAASDEAPANIEPEFWLTLEHIKRGQVHTSISTRYPGGSHLNDVERQHSAAKRALNGVYIPSTTWGRNMNWKEPEGRSLFEDNMNTAADMLIDKAQGSYGGSKIHFVKGATMGYTEILEMFKVFLRGTKEERGAYMLQYSEQWNFFEDVQLCMSRHRVDAGIDRYQFTLSPCYISDCIHPICSDPNRHEAAENAVWGPGLPLLSCVFRPVPDPKFPWGSTECDRCGAGKICRGHFLPPEEAFAAISEDPSCQFSSYPSSIIEGYIQKTKAKGRKISKQSVVRLAKRCLLSVEEIELVVDHFLTYATYSGGKKRL